MGNDRNGRRGFTLLEMLIAIAILSGVMLGVALVLSSTGNVATLEAARNEIERVNQEALDRMAMELRDTAARVTTVAADGTAVRFQIPVRTYDLPYDIRVASTEPVLDATGAIRFGFLERNGPATMTPRNGTITYQFVQNTVAGQPDVRDESALNMDFNGDMDGTDRFARGRILRITQITGFAAVTDPVPIGIWIAQPDGNPGGDLSGDGLPDPIFQLDPATNSIVINLWAVELDGNKNQHFVRSTTSICLRNR